MRLTLPWTWLDRLMCSVTLFTVAVFLYLAWLLGMVLSPQLSLLSCIHFTYSM